MDCLCKSWINTYVLLNQPAVNVISDQLEVKDRLLCTICCTQVVKHCGITAILEYLSNSHWQLYKDNGSKIRDLASFRKYSFPEGPGKNQPARKIWPPVE